MPAANSSVLALDVGERRVGVAVASRAARLPRALTTLERGQDFIDKLRAIAAAENIDSVVVGLPRGLNGQSTAQTVAVEAFADELKENFAGITFDFQDEALTSHQAESELMTRGKVYKKGDVDALAAVYILEDWLASQPVAAEAA